jgi:hypothetical protein
MRDRQRERALAVSRRELMAHGGAAIIAAGGLATSLPAQAAGTRFVFANESDYDTVDPHAAFDVGRVAVRLNLYDGLMRWQKNPAVLEPWVAESYAISSDGLHYTFRMRKGVKFHDGTEVKAQDVVYSLDRILALGKGASSLFKTMIDPGAARAVDDYTVEFILKKPSAIFLSIVPEVHIVNAALLKRNETGGDWGQAWLSKNEAGSGAYQLTQFDPAVGFVAQRFADHFKGWGPKWLDEIEFRGVRDTNTRVLGLLRDDFQGIGGYLQTDQLNRIKSNGNAQVLEAESMRVMMAQFNMTRAPINDVHVRRAISYAFDYDGFNNDILGGLVERNPTPLPNTIWGVPKDVKGYTFDLDQAKAELAKPRSTNRSSWPSSPASSSRNRPRSCCRTASPRPACRPRWWAIRGRPSSTSSRIPTQPPMCRSTGSPPTMPIRTIGLVRCSHPRRPAPSRTPPTTGTQRWTHCSTRRLVSPTSLSEPNSTRRQRALSSTKRRACGSTTPSGMDPIRTSSRASSSVRSARRRRCAPPTTKADEKVATVEGFDLVCRPNSNPDVPSRGRPAVDE